MQRPDYPRQRLWSQLTGAALAAAPDAEEASRQTHQDASTDVDHLLLVKVRRLPRSPLEYLTDSILHMFDCQTVNWSFFSCAGH